MTALNRSENSRTRLYGKSLEHTVRYLDFEPPAAHCLKFAKRRRLCPSLPLTSSLGETTL